MVRTIGMSSGVKLKVAVHARELFLLLLNNRRCLLIILSSACEIIERHTASSIDYVGQ